MQKNSWKFVTDELPMRSTIELKDNSNMIKNFLASRKVSTKKTRLERPQIMVAWSCFLSIPEINRNL